MARTEVTRPLRSLAYGRRLLVGAYISPTRCLSGTPVQALLCRGRCRSALAFNFRCGLLKARRGAFGATCTIAISGCVDAVAGSGRYCGGATPVALCLDSTERGSADTLDLPPKRGPLWAPARNNSWVVSRICDVRCPDDASFSQGLYVSFSPYGFGVTPVPWF